MWGLMSPKMRVIHIKAIFPITNLGSLNDPGYSTDSFVINLLASFTYRYWSERCTIFQRNSILSYWYQHGEKEPKSGNPGNSTAASIHKDETKVKGRDLAQRHLTPIRPQVKSPDVPPSKSRRVPLLKQLTSTLTKASSPFTSKTSRVGFYLQNSILISFLFDECHSKYTA